MLRLSKVGKRYGRSWVLKTVDLEVPPTSLTVIRGANGSGKSTLLRLIAGVSQPSAGVVSGRPARVAVVPDRFVPPRMRAREYLRHFSRLRGVDVPTAERRLHELAEELSIAPWLDVPLQAMSRGTAQKVALAQAFLAPLDLVVLDEPQAALDDAAVGALCALVDRARRQGAAIVVADHGPPLGVDAITYVLDEATLKRSSLE